MSSHERFEAPREIETSSDRSFGLVFAFLLMIIGISMIVDGDVTAFICLFFAGTLFLAAALISPGILAPLNKIWTRFGSLMHMIISPIVLGIIYFFVISSVASVMRMLGKNPLRLDFDRGEKTYWIKRGPRGPSSGGFRDQF